MKIAAKYFVFYLIFLISCSEEISTTYVLELKTSQDPVKITESDTGVSCKYDISISEIYGIELFFVEGRETIKDANKTEISAQSYSALDLANLFGVESISPLSSFAISHETISSNVDLKLPLGIEWIIVLIDSQNNLYDYVLVITCEE